MLDISTEDIYQVSTEEVYQDGQIIFGEGSSGDWIYVVQKGGVELSKKMKDKSIIIEKLKEGGVFGELGFIAKTPRSATARAIGDTVVGIIDRNFLDQEFNKLSGSFRTILKSLALRLQKTTETAINMNIYREESKIPKIIAFSFKDKKNFIKAFSTNALSGSSNRIFIKTPKPIAKGERFLLKIKIPGSSDAITIGCEVAESRTETNDPKLPPGMSVKFTHISKEDRIKLREVLKKIK
ncbi:Cyclic nucleotide-binding domain-containing protein [Candidatus Magnetomoraceae bacterium gMMP-15]